MPRAKPSANQAALDGIAGPDLAEADKPQGRRAAAKATPAAFYKLSGAAIPGMPAPGKVVVVDIRDMPAWREKNKARVDHFERRGKDVIGWIAEAKPDGE